MKKHIAKILTVCFGLFVTTACLDDEKYALDPGGYKNVIEFLDPNVPASVAGSIYPAWVEAFPIVEEDQFVRTISFSGPNDNNEDIEIEIAVDPFALEDYNAQQLGEDGLDGPTYELLPANHYEIATTHLTIPKGQKTVDIHFKVFPMEFDLSKKYALPIRIVSASKGILSQHFSVGIFAVVIKNKYDAAYTTSIYAEGWGAYGLWDGQEAKNYPDLMGLVTTGPNTVGIFNYWAQTNLLPGFDEAGNGTQYGAASPEFTFDLETDRLISVANTIPPDTRNRTFTINPDAPEDHNVFDPETRSVTLDFIFKQDGRPDYYQVFKLTFKRER